jgi:uncharacterized membrane protein
VEYFSQHFLGRPLLGKNCFKNRRIKSIPRGSEFAFLSDQEFGSERISVKSTGRGLLFLAILLCIPAQALPSYSFADLHPAGWIESHATCVNGRGEVAGYGITGYGERGFLWSAGLATELLPPGASSARAAWVNGRGDVAGTAVIAGRTRAFLYRNGTYLDPTPGWAFSTAVYVAEDGAVTGAGEFGAYISRDGVTELLPEFTVVVAANAAGQLLGSADNTVRLFLPGSGYLTIQPPGENSAVPGGLNDSGLVAVSSRQADTEKGFVYSGGFYIFMTPPGWSSSNAMAINNRAQVVGYGVSPAGCRSFLRTAAAYDELSFPGWTSTEAVSLNDFGQVAGSGSTASGETHAFLASPSGPAAAGNSFGGDGGMSAGGCGMVDGGRRAPFNASSAMGLLALLLPLLPSLIRAGLRHTPMILTRTRFGRRPSHSP